MDFLGKAFAGAQNNPDRLSHRAAPGACPRPSPCLRTVPALQPGERHAPPPPPAAGVPARAPLSVARRIPDRGTIPSGSGRTFLNTHRWTHHRSTRSRDSRRCLWHTSARSPGLYQRLPPCEAAWTPPQPTRRARAHVDHRPPDPLARQAAALKQQGLDWRSIALQLWPDEPLPTEHKASERRRKRVDRLIVRGRLDALPEKK